MQTDKIGDLGKQQQQTIGDGIKLSSILQTELAEQNNS
jgi:hypothetical protein